MNRYGKTTTLAHQNFQISGITAPQIFQKALGLVKLASFQANCSLGLINPSHQKAISQAIDEFISGDFNSDFTLDIFQAGAGTSYNMNANEVIANRANELLGKELVHPNDHVNMAQSTNDVIPTTIRVATLLLLPKLFSEIKALEQSISKIAKKHAKLTKVGRTHLQDAVPITLGQEFDAYKEALKKSRQFIEQTAKSLKILGLGGTAVGTGITAHPKYSTLAIKNLSKLTKINFTPAKNFTEIANNMNVFMNFSAALRSLTTNLLNFSSDLKLMNSGPTAGLGEITLPTVQPGSSIMPGKVNPSIVECVEMICLQVLGNDRVIELACQKSNFELNVYGPIIMYNLIQSVEILTNGLNTLRTKAIDNLQINTARISKLFEQSLCTATALNPHLGYALTADIVKTALREHRTIKEEVLKRKLLSEKELDKIL